MMDEARHPQPGYLLGGLLIAVLIISQIAFAVAFGIPPREDNGLASIATGVYLLFVGLLFVAAYFFSHRTFLFRAIMWVCEHFSAPRGRGMAFFYAGLFFFLGTVAILRGLG